jgi:hypothetical protein
MKSFLLAAICIVVIGYGASVVLNDNFQADSTAVFTTEGARLSTGEAEASTN